MMNRLAIVGYLAFALVAVSLVNRLAAQTQPVAGLTSTAVIAGTTGPPSLFANGSAAAPSIAFAATPGLGLFNSSGSLGIAVSAAVPRFFFTTTQLLQGSTSIIGWSNTVGDASGAIDTGITRNAAGVVEVNNGTAGQRASLTTNNGGAIIHGAVTFATLNTNVANGTQVFCSDCAAGAIDVTCTGGGTGAMAFRINGVWRCLS